MQPQNAGEVRPTQNEIERAHDVLAQLLILQILPDDDQSDLTMAARVLCWVLGHGVEFAELLTHSEAILNGEGVRIGSRINAN
jgi:hypothetical protein